MSFWEPSSPEAYRRQLRSERHRAGLCEACGEEPRRPGKRLGAICADRNAAASARRAAERRRERTGLSGGVRKRKRCDICGEPGHFAKTCRVQPGPGRRQCLRCREWALPGELHCLSHKTTLEQNEREGWFQE